MELIFVATYQQYSRTIFQVGLLSLIAWSGAQLSAWLAWPVPGNVVGIALLLLLLALRIIPLEWVEKGAEFLLGNMLLFFIPAAVGIVEYRDLMAARGLGIVAVIAFSTAVVMAVSGVVADRLARRSGEEGEQHGRP